MAVRSCSECMRKKRAPAGLLHIIPMGGDGENVDRGQDRSCRGRSSIRGVVVIARRVHVGHIVSRPDDRHLRVVDRRTIGGAVDVDLPTLGGIDLVQS